MRPRKTVRQTPTSAPLVNSREVEHRGLAKVTAVLYERAGRVVKKRMQRVHFGVGGLEGWRRRVRVRVEEMIEAGPR